MSWSFFMGSCERQGPYISDGNLQALEKVQYMKEVELPKALGRYGFMLHGVGCTDEVVNQKMVDLGAVYCVASRRQISDFINATRELFKGVFGLKGDGIDDEFLDNFVGLTSDEPERNLRDAIERHDVLSTFLRGNATSIVKERFVERLKRGVWSECTDWRAEMGEYMAAYRVRPDLFGVFHSEISPPSISGQSVNKLPRANARGIL